MTCSRAFLFYQIRPRKRSRVSCSSARRLRSGQAILLQLRHTRRDTWMRPASSRTGASRTLANLHSRGLRRLRCQAVASSAKEVQAARRTWAAAQCHWAAAPSPCLGTLALQGRCHLCRTPGAGLRAPQALQLGPRARACLCAGAQAAFRSSLLRRGSARMRRANHRADHRSRRPRGGRGSATSPPQPEHWLRGCWTIGSASQRQPTR